MLQARCSQCFFLATPQELLRFTFTNTKSSGECVMTFPISDLRPETDFLDPKLRLLRLRPRLLKLTAELFRPRTRPLRLRARVLRLRTGLSRLKPRLRVKATSSNFKIP